MKIKRYSLRISLFYAFLAIVFISSGGILSAQYYFSQQLAQSAADKNFTLVGSNISDHINAYSHEISGVVSLLAANQFIGEPEQGTPVDLFRTALSGVAGAYAVYFGTHQGDFYELINLQSEENLRENFKAPDEARWLLIEIGQPGEDRLQRSTFLNEQLEQVAQRTEPTQYDPRLRPWFKQATESAPGQLISTPPYIFSMTQAPGVTFAKTLANGAGVLALDISLNNLNTFLQAQKFHPESRLFLYDEQGALIAASETLEGPSVQPESLHNSEYGTLVNYVSEGQEYFGYKRAIRTADGTSLTLGLSVPREVMTAPFTRQINIAALIGLMTLLITIPIIRTLTRKFLRPIHLLMEENTKIKERRYSEVQPVKTSILELHALSKSLLDMSESIQDYEKRQEELLDSFIRLISVAIDTKSPYTGGHCERVPQLATALVEAASRERSGPFANFEFTTEDEWREFRISAWLHDCGKVTTPEYVVDKATKLETISNRIHEVRLRFEILWRDAEIEALNQLALGTAPDEVEQQRRDRQQQLQDDFEFVAQCNIGGEFMTDESIERLQQIARNTWLRHFDDRLGLSMAELGLYEGIAKPELPVVETLLSDRPEHIVKRHNFDASEYERRGFKLDVPEHLYNRGELYNLSVRRGTLTAEERFKINDHIIQTIEMLEQLPLPDNLKRIPEYAGAHHETLIGTGYPRRLVKEQLSIPSRVMAIADIFEALTAADRPYKPPKKLSEALKIMKFMVKDQHIDGDLFELFLRKGVYRDYALKMLKPEQIDEINIEDYL